MRVLIIAAHPDDEAVGASALLSCRDPAVVVHVTNGAPRDPRWWPAGVVERDTYAQTRAREAERALSIVGAERIALPFDDQGLVFVLADVIHVLAGLIARLRPDVIVTHAYEGGHPDHDAVACAIAGARAALASHVPLFEMALYHGAPGVLRAGELLGSGDEIRHRLDPVQRRRRAAMLSAYRSQRTVLAPFAELAHECYRPAPAYDFSRPPHGGLLLYERWGMGPSGEEWRALATRALARCRRGRCVPLLGA